MEVEEMFRMLASLLTVIALVDFTLASGNAFQGNWTLVASNGAMGLGISIVAVSLWLSEISRSLKKIAEK